MKWRLLRPSFGSNISPLNFSFEEVQPKVNILVFLSFSVTVPNCYSELSIVVI